MKDKVFKKLGGKWCIKWGFLKDVYFLMTQDIRFYSGRGGIRYTKMEKHLADTYGIELNERKLRYLVTVVKKQNRKGDG